MITAEEEKRLIELRRGKVSELYSKEYSQTEISKILNVSEATISRDIKVLKIQARENIDNLIDEQLPEEYSKVLTGFHNKRVMDCFFKCSG
jgi:Trp operon repressor